MTDEKWFEIWDILTDYGVWPSRKCIQKHSKIELIKVLFNKLKER